MVYCFVLQLELSTQIAEEYDLQQVHDILGKKKLKRKSHEEDKIPFIFLQKEGNIIQRKKESTIKEDDQQSKERKP